MRPLRYSINVTLDGCCDHQGIIPDLELHQHAAENLRRADALLFGRVIYEMMESAWRIQPGHNYELAPERPDWMADWMVPFGQTIDAAKKYVVSKTLAATPASSICLVEWNAELLRGDLREAVEELKQAPGRGLFTGGVKFPLALAELGLIDEYELIVHPRIAGHGPTLFAGLSQPLDLELVGSPKKFASGAVALQYRPRK